MKDPKKKDSKPVGPVKGAGEVPKTATEAKATEAKATVTKATATTETTEATVTKATETTEATEATEAKIVGAPVGTPNDTILDLLPEERISRSKALNLVRGQGLKCSQERMTKIMEEKYGPAPTREELKAAREAKKAEAKKAKEAKAKEAQEARKAKLLAKAEEKATLKAIREAKALEARAAKEAKEAKEAEAKADKTGPVKPGAAKPAV